MGTLEAMLFGRSHRLAMGIRCLGSLGLGLGVVLGAIALCSPAALAERAFLSSEDSDSRINIRSGPSTQTTALHYGFAGDIVETLRGEYGENGYLWYFVRFEGSGAEGWVREDLLRFPSEGGLSDYFISEHWNFEVAYPAGYVVDRTNEANYTTQGFINFFPEEIYSAIQAGVTDVPGDSIGVNIYRNVDYFPPLEWAETYDNFSNLGDKHRALTFAGQEAIAYSWCGLVCGDTILFSDPTETLILMLSVTYDDPQAAIRSDFQLMSSSFSFLD